MAFFGVVLVATEASHLVRYFTRFTEEGFCALISLIFIYDSLKKMLSLAEAFPINWHYRLDNVTSYSCTCNLSSPGEPQQPWAGGEQEAAAPGSHWERVSWLGGGRHCRRRMFNPILTFLSTLQCPPLPSIQFVHIFLPPGTAQDPGRAVQGARRALAHLLCLQDGGCQGLGLDGFAISSPVCKSGAGKGHLDGFALLFLAQSVNQGLFSGA